MSHKHKHFFFSFFFWVAALELLWLVCLKCYYSVIIDKEWCDSQSVSISSCGCGLSLRQWPWPSTETFGLGVAAMERICPSVAVPEGCYGESQWSWRGWVPLLSLSWTSGWFLLSDRDCCFQKSDAFSPCLNVSYIYIFFLEVDL